MRRLISVIVVAATTVLVPMFAMAGNQEVADNIAKRLRNSGKMSDYHIAVKYQNGTAWLKGRVASEEQMNTALKLVYRTPGVSRVVNVLTIGESSAAASNAQRVSGNYMRSSVRQASAIEPNMLPQQRMAQIAARPINGPTPIPVAMTQSMPSEGDGMPMSPRPMYTAAQGGVAPARYDQPCMPNYAWPSYAAYPNYAAVTYPKQYSPTAWPYIGPFYPYPQVPLGWRKVTLQWKDGWWFLDFKDEPASCWRR